MKKCFILIIFGMLFFLFPTLSFASGRLEVSVTNSTGREIDKIIIKESDTEKIDMRSIILKNNSSTNISVKKETYYDIILVDNRGHHYGKMRTRFVEKRNEVIIRNNDYVPESVWGIIKKLLGL